MVENGIVNELMWFFVKYLCENVWHVMAVTNGIVKFSSTIGCRERFYTWTSQSSWSWTRMVMLMTIDKDGDNDGQDGDGDGKDGDDDGT